MPRLFDIEPWRDYLAAFDEVLREPRNRRARTRMRLEFDARVRGNGGAAMSSCICGKHMIQRVNEGTCLWCGHGPARMVRDHAYELNMAGNTTARFEAGVVPIRDIARAKLYEWDEGKCIAAARLWEKRRGRLPRSGDWLPSEAVRGADYPSYGTVRRLFGGWSGFLRAIAEVPRDQAAA